MKKIYKNVNLDISIIIYLFIFITLWLHSAIYVAQVFWNCHMNSDVSTVEPQQIPMQNELLYPPYPPMNLPTPSAAGPGVGTSPFTVNKKENEE